MKKKQEKLKQKAETNAMLAEIMPAKPESVDGETPDEEEKRLLEEIRKKRSVLEKVRQEASVASNKLLRARELDKEEEERDRKFSRILDKASYNHGVVRGKISSSDVHFNYILQDTQRMQAKKVITVTRACSLMERKIEDMKGEVRSLLKVACETLPAPPTEGISLTDPSGSHKEGVTTEEEASPTASERSKHDEYQLA